MLTAAVGAVLGLVLTFAPKSVGFGEEWRAVGAVVLVLVIGLVVLQKKENA
jgi:general stress protein CsbA